MSSVKSPFSRSLLPTSLSRTATAMPSDLVLTLGLTMVNSCCGIESYQIVITKLSLSRCDIYTLIMQKLLQSVCVCVC